ncbi:MAG: division/cell wall cluster transcriptional repressor MraZ, partial [Candidatus Puniceispirillaceae bacterium]
GNQGSDWSVRMKHRSSRLVELFLSTFENRIDKKGRLSVPAPFRAVLERRRDPLFLFKSLTEPCLEGCGAERIEQIVDAIDSMDSLSSEVATLQTMLSSAQEMKLDAEGRIMLSADFIDFAELDETALYAGIGRSFQIWLPERYRSREANARARAKTDGLPSLRLGRGAPRSTADNGDR